MIGKNQLFFGRCKSSRLWALLHAGCGLCFMQVVGSVLCRLWALFHAGCEFCFNILAQF